jgi:hypothetical protein
MRIIVSVLFLCLMAVAPAASQDKPSPAAVDAARELLAIMSPDMTKQLASVMLDPVMQNLDRQMGGRIDVQTLAELRREIERIGNRFIMESMADAPALYARHFTETELREMIAFYRTPTGAKALNTLPKLSGEMMTLLLPRMPALQKELETAVGGVLRKAQGAR